MSKRRHTPPLRVAVVGIQGVPARYGGFESLVENLIGDNCPSDVSYTVFCSSKDMPERMGDYKGARLKYIPLKANGMQSVFYDAWSLCRCFAGYDVIVVLGVSGGWFLPFFRLFNRSRLIINIDGLEYRRAKWGKWARSFLHMSEGLAIRYADIVITDNKGIKDYVKDEYGLDSALIPYGGDQVRREVSRDFSEKTLRSYDLDPGEYAIAVCRIEPENNTRMVLEAFARAKDKKIIYIGNWDHSDYSRRLYNQFKDIPNIRLQSAIYDLDILYVLRSNAGCYIHGHSAGGTNPSLVEAMHLGRPILAYDVVYNRETTEGRASYFSDSVSLCNLLSAGYDDGSSLREIAERRYTWAEVSKGYVDLYRMPAK